MYQRRNQQRPDVDRQLKAQGALVHLLSPREGEGGIEMISWLTFSSAKLRQLPTNRA